MSNMENGIGPRRSLMEILSIDWEAVRTDVQYGERYRSEAKSDGDTRYRLGLGWE